MGNNCYVRTFYFHVDNILILGGQFIILMWTNNCIMWTFFSLRTIYVVNCTHSHSQTYNYYFSQTRRILEITKQLQRNTTKHDITLDKAIVGSCKLTLCCRQSKTEHIHSTNLTNIASNIEHPFLNIHIINVSIMMILHTYTKKRYYLNPLLNNIFFLC